MAICESLASYKVDYIRTNESNERESRENCGASNAVGTKTDRVKATLCPEVRGNKRDKNLPGVKKMESGLTD